VLLLPALGSGRGRNIVRVDYERRLKTRNGGLQIAISALPVLTYLNVRSAPVLDITIFAPPFRVLSRIRSQYRDSSDRIAAVDADYLA
jgi:hypothetical protein